MRTGTVYLDRDLFMNYHFFCYTYWSNNRADIFRVGEILIKYSWTEHLSRKIWKIPLIFHSVCLDNANEHICQESTRNNKWFYYENLLNQAKSLWKCDAKMKWNMEFGWDTQNQRLFLIFVRKSKKKIHNKEKVETFIKIIKTFLFFRREVYKTVHTRNNIFTSDKRIIILHMRTKQRQRASQRGLSNYGWKMFKTWIWGRGIGM